MILWIWFLNQEINSWIKASKIIILVTHLGLEWVLKMHQLVETAAVLVRLVLMVSNKLW